MTKKKPVNKKLPQTKHLIKRDPELTELELRFCEEYLIDLNGTQAYIRAKGSDITERAATVQATRLLAKPNISHKIAQLAKDRSERTQITADRVLEETFKLAFSDIRQLFSADGALLNPVDWPDDIAKAVSQVKVDELFDYQGDHKQKIGETKQVKLWEKTKMIALLGKHFNLFKDKLEVSGSVSLADLFKKPLDHDD